MEHSSPSHWQEGQTRSLVTGFNSGLCNPASDLEFTSYSEVPPDSADLGQHDVQRHSVKEKLLSRGVYHRPCFPCRYARKRRKRINQDSVISSRLCMDVRFAVRGWRFVNSKVMFVILCPGPVCFRGSGSRSHTFRRSWILCLNTSVLIREKWMIKLIEDKIK